MAFVDFVFCGFCGVGDWRVFLNTAEGFTQRARCLVGYIEQFVKQILNYEPSFLSHLLKKIYFANRKTLSGPQKKPTPKEGREGKGGRVGGEGREGRDKQATLGYLRQSPIEIFGAVHRFGQNTILWLPKATPRINHPTINACVGWLNECPKR